MSLHDAEASNIGLPSTLEGVVLTNCFVRDESSPDGVVCVAMSRFNHSCDPNCEGSWNEACGERRIYASRDVTAGEELCIFYSDVRAPWEERREELLLRYGFGCHCAACASTGSDTGSSDRRRTRMLELDSEIGRVGAADPEQGLLCARELLNLYDEEGLHTQSFRKRACFFMFQLSLLRRDLEEARHWAQRAWKYSELSFGADHSDTQLLSKFARDPSAHPAWAP
mmetsp:Transcript_61898/g.200568  ORF Transcript_61898/g.200568 Transcript_61898/m.200568 type:complete len:226 (+) Transcript_61898:280-957(+)